MTAVTRAGGRGADEAPVGQSQAVLHRGSGDAGAAGVDHPAADPRDPVALAGRIRGPVQIVQDGEVGRRVPIDLSGRAAGEEPDGRQGADESHALSTIDRPARFAEPSAAHPGSLGRFRGTASSVRDASIAAGGPDAGSTMTKAAPPSMPSSTSMAPLPSLSAYVHY